MNKDDRLSILLIDDDEVDRLLVKRAFQKANFPVSLIEAEDGAKAIDKLKIQQNSVTNLNPSHSSDSSIAWQPNSFDLILLDYRLPDINGLNLIKSIRALEIDIPLIMLTGQGDEEIAVEIMKAGAADYLAKAKIEPNNLVKAINNAIRVHQAEQAVAIANRRLQASNELLTKKNKELKKQQEQIKLQNIKLQESYKLKSEFLATMSHELRTPMNAIMGFSQLLLRSYPDPLSPQQHSLVERIFNNSKNLLDMINEMLDFSKIEAGKLDLKPVQLDIANLIVLTVEELRSLAVQKDLSLETEIDVRDRLISQDSSALKRSLVNLLSNAIKFTDAGEVKVKVWEPDKDKIAIAVTDTGIGIAEEDLNKIFQAFRQADQTFTRKHAGTGLGLAITESLVSMMGGKISVTSKLDRGSTFQIEIPRQLN